MPISQIPSTFLYGPFHLCVNRAECNNFLTFSHHFTHNRIERMTCVVRTEKKHHECHHISNFHKNFKNIVELM